VRGGGDTITDINQRERERYAISVVYSAERRSTGHK